MEVYRFVSSAMGQNPTTIAEHSGLYGSKKIYSEPLRHALQPCIGLSEGIYDLM